MDAAGLRAVASICRKPRSGTGKLVASGIALAVVGACWLWANSDAVPTWSRACEAEACFYHLPSPEARSVIERRAAAKLEERDGDEDGEDDEAAEGRRGDATASGRCVCCHERDPELVFVGCGHLCVCEVCLIQMAEVHEVVVLRSRFKGPVKMPCPLCRTNGFLIKARTP